MTPKHQHRHSSQEISRPALRCGTEAPSDHYRGNSKKRQILIFICEAVRNSSGPNNCFQRDSHFETMTYKRTSRQNNSSCFHVSSVTLVSTIVQPAVGVVNACSIQRTIINYNQSMDVYSAPQQLLHNFSVATIDPLFFWWSNTIASSIHELFHMLAICTAKFVAANTEQHVSQACTTSTSS